MGVLEWEDVNRANTPAAEGVFRVGGGASPSGGGGAEDDWVDGWLRRTLAAARKPRTPDHIRSMCYSLRTLDLLPTMSSERVTFALLPPRIGG